MDSNPHGDAVDLSGSTVVCINVAVSSRANGGACVPVDRRSRWSSIGAGHGGCSPLSRCSCYKEPRPAVALLAGRHGLSTSKGQRVCPHLDIRQTLYDCEEGRAFTRTNRRPSVVNRWSHSRGQAPHDGRGADNGGIIDAPGPA